MLVRIDPSSTAPLYEQVATSVRRALAERHLRPGERLPPAKELAATLDINVHTVLRAYSQLRDEGLIDLRRRRGAVVIGATDGHARLTALATELVAEARRNGVEVEELATIVRRTYA